MEIKSYLNYPETESCYLDGRYFNKVFEDYPGLLKEPLRIKIVERKRAHRHLIHSEQSQQVFINMREEKIDMKQPGLLRLIITLQVDGKTSRHSNLLILNYANNTVYRFEPLGKTAPYFEKINEVIENYLSLFLDFQLEVIDINLDEVWHERNPKCAIDRSGFCTAYIILYAYCFIKGCGEYDPQEIRRFAKFIETNYGPLPREGAEVEYGLVTGAQGNTGQNALIGGLGGATLGALAGGPTGLLLGGLGGAVAGSLF